MPALGPIPATNLIEGLERQSRAWSALGLAMLVLIGLISAWSLAEVNAADSLVNHTYNVVSASEQLLSALEDSQAAVQGYLLSGEESNLVPYHAAITAVPENFRILRNLSSDNASQQRRLDALQPLLANGMIDLTELVRLRKEFGLQAAEKARSTEKYKQVRNRILQLGGEIQKEEYRLLQQRLVTRQDRLWRGLAATVSSAALALLALILAPILVRRAVKQRDLVHRQKQETESMAQSLFEAAPQAILIVDRSGTIVTANPEAEKIFGYKPEELSGQSVEVLIPEQESGEHIAHREQYMPDPRNRPMGLNLNLKARRKDGSKFDAEISLSSINRSNDTLTVAFASDISQRRADEKEIREQREELRYLAGKLMTAEEDERRRISRNLHDDLSQTLASIAIDLGRLAVKSGSEGISPNLRPLQSRASEAAERVRMISHQLHPSILDDLGLKAALEEFCNEFEMRSGIHTNFTSQNVPDYLPSDISSCAYHIAGECLRNVHKHSRSKTAYVNLEVVQGGLRLRVRDEGIGFNRAPSGLHAGIGIVAMKERARLLGGAVLIQSGLQKGTKIVVELPVSVMTLPVPSGNGDGF
jgi:PAS domain S-box-containing protein